MYLIQIILMSSKNMPHSFIRKVFVVGGELPVLKAPENEGRNSCRESVDEERNGL